MGGCFRTRIAHFEWSDYTDVRISPSPTKHSKVTAAVKKEGQTWTFRQRPLTRPQIYVRKTVSINGDILRGRDIPREYEIWSSLGKHPYVLACEDFQCLANAYALDEATFWSKYCEMGDLGQFVMIQGSRHRSLSSLQADQIAYQISSALAFIHYGLFITLDDYGSVEKLDLFDHTTLMHRDIKPQNIFISRLYRSHFIHVKLGDFGCAKQLDDDTSMTDTGTIRYQAPESRCTSLSDQFQRPSSSVKSDIWSFGATMRDITDDMPSFCDDCCHDDPTKRPSSVQLLEYLQQRMRHEQDVSPFVVEALRKDTDSTFWDYPLIERLLEAGADPTIVGPGTITSIQLLTTNTSNKSAKDVESVNRLLLKYGTSPGIESGTITKNRISMSSRDSLSLVPDELSRGSKDAENVLQLLGTPPNTNLSAISDNHMQTSLSSRDRSSGLHGTLQNTPSSSVDRLQTPELSPAEIEVANQVVHPVVQSAAQDQTNLSLTVRSNQEVRMNSTLTPPIELDPPSEGNEDLTLKPTIPKAAHDMGEIAACWPCVLQQDKCGQGDICDRCLERPQRVNTDLSLGCTRIKLVKLSPYFLPQTVMLMHKNSYLTPLFQRHIHQWGNREILLHLSPGLKDLPGLPVKVYEFIPQCDPNMLPQMENVFSPSLAILHVSDNEETTYKEYLSEIVDDHLDSFSEFCWKGDHSEFQKELFRLMIQLKPKRNAKRNGAALKQIKKVLRLIVCTFCMSNTLWSSDQLGPTTFNINMSDAIQFPSFHLLNLQAQYCFAQCQRSILNTVLDKLQQILESAQDCDERMLAFITVIGLAMASEIQQKRTYLTIKDRICTNGLQGDNMYVAAQKACSDIDQQMGFVFNLFAWKYTQGWNPSGLDHELLNSVGFDNKNSAHFIRQLRALIRENVGFMRKRQEVEHKETFDEANLTRYTSRLVSRFLLSIHLELPQSEEPTKSA